MAITRTGLDDSCPSACLALDRRPQPGMAGAALAGYGGAVFVLLAVLVTLSLLQDSQRTPFLAGQWGLIAVMLLLLVVTARIGLRMRTASGLTRRSLSPVLVTAVVEVAVVVGLLIAQQASGDRDLAGSAGWAFVLTVPAFALAFLLGSIRARLFAAEALKKIAAGLEHNTSPTPEQLEPILAVALEDPSLRLVQRTGEDGQWLVDVNQRPVELSEGADQRAMSDRDPGRGPARVGDRARCRAEPSARLGAGRGRSHEHCAGQRPPDRGGRCIAGRASRLAESHPVRRRYRATADRAQHPRRCPAAHRRTSHQARACARDPRRTRERGRHTCSTGSAMRRSGYSTNCAPSLAASTRLS